MSTEPREQPDVSPCIKLTVLVIEIEQIGLVQADHLVK